MNPIDILSRNSHTIRGEKARKNQVNIEYWKARNVGDRLGPAVCGWMLEQKGIDPSAGLKKTRHLLSVGSILALGKYPVDACVWGSGIYRIDNIRMLALEKMFRKLDVRAVRGPVTKEVLDVCGYRCPAVFGDPAVLMPLVYRSEAVKERGKVSAVLHFRQADRELPAGINRIDVRTEDYRPVIDEICSSELVVSSSLHGIILAESYGVPAVFLQEDMEDVLLKYYDWYYGSGRKNIRFAYSMEEALNMTPMDLPDTEAMQKTLADAFPYDLWNS